MGANHTVRDPIPDRFKTVEEFDEFWGAHSLADYDDIQRDVHFNILLKDEPITLKPPIADEIYKRARQRNLSVNELVNRMLEEQLEQPA